MFLQGQNIAAVSRHMGPMPTKLRHSVPVKTIAVARKINRRQTFRPVYCGINTFVVDHPLPSISRA